MTIPNIDQPVETDASNRRMLMVAATLPERDAFTFQDLVEVVRGQSLAAAFKKWAVERFYEVADAGVLFEVVEGRAVGRTMKVERPTSGWSDWHVREVAPALAVAGEPVHIRMEKVTANDRGPADYGPTVKFPLDLLFGERQRAERYAEYLTLKAEFENEGGVR